MINDSFPSRVLHIFGASLTRWQTFKCVVAQDHFSTGIFETTFALAVRCAKSIGVNQWRCFEGQLSDEDLQERRNVSYFVFVLDKTLCWTVGTSPYIPISDVHIDSTFMPANDSTTTNLVARAQLAKIRETIYWELYSSQPGVRTEDQIRQITSVITKELECWLADWGIDLAELESAPETSASKIGLAIDFLCTQLLFVSPYKGHPDVMFRENQEVAKRCMRLLLRLWHTTSDSQNHTAFPLSVLSIL